MTIDVMFKILEKFAFLVFKFLKLKIYLNFPRLRDDSHFGNSPMYTECMLGSSCIGDLICLW